MFWMPVLMTHVLKPCDVREIEARLWVVHRRHQQRQQDLLIGNELTLDIQSHKCCFRNKGVHLTTREVFVT